MNYRLSPQQMAHAATVRILAARTIVTPSCFDCFPARNEPKKFAEQSCLTAVGLETADAYDERLGYHNIYDRHLLKRKLTCVSFLSTVRLEDSLLSNRARLCRCHIAFLLLDHPRLARE